MFKSILFIITTYNAYVISHEDSILKLFKPISGFKFGNSSFYYAEKKVDSSLQCGLECMDSEYCSSFSYNHDSRTCLISSLFVNSISALVSDPQFTHFQYKSSVFPKNVTLSWRYQPRVVATPDYPYSRFVNNSLYVRLLVPKGHTINILFSTFNIEEANCFKTQEGITIDQGDTVLTQALHLCSSNNTTIPFIFKSRERILQIRTKSSVSRILFKARYFFEKDGENSDNCDMLSCPINSECVSTGCISSCECFQGYVGRQCNFDPCFLNPCHNNGLCLNINDSVKCLCADKFSGRYCDKIVDPCLSKPCLNGVCHSENSTNYYCECGDGYTGISCETNIDECSSNPCSSLHCIDGINQYYCKCPQCIHGLCLYKNSQPFCWCFPGYEGTNCSDNIDECLSNPCVHGHCTDHSDGYKCTCESGYTGWNCDHYIPRECDNSYCANGDCIEYKPGTNKCVCPLELTGKYCENNLEWCQRKCLHVCLVSFNYTNISKCLQKCNSFCDDKSDNVTSSTVVEIKGTFLTTPSSKYSIRTTSIHDNCQHHCTNGQCIYENESTICKCHYGYVGTYCNDVAVTCPCFHGDCLSNGSTPCVCDPLYTGILCDTALTGDSCNDIRCVHGHCEDGICRCNAPFIGRRCNESSTTTNVTCDTVSCDANEGVKSTSNRTITVLLVVVIVLVAVLFVLIAFLISSRCKYKRGSFSFEDVSDSHTDSHPTLINLSYIYQERQNRNYLTVVTTLPHHNVKPVVENESNPHFRRLMKAEQYQNDDISLLEERHQSGHSSSISSSLSDPYDFPPSRDHHRTTGHKYLNSQSHRIGGVETGKSEV